MTEYYNIPAEVPYRGYTLEKLSLVPRPVNQPVEVWQPLVSGNPKGVEFMAKMGIKPLISNTPGPMMAERVEMYRQASAGHGRELDKGEDVAFGYRFFIADSQAEAVKKTRPYFEEAMKFAAPLGLMALNQEQIDAVAAGGANRGVTLPTLEEAVDNRTWLCGEPAQIIDHLKKVEAEYPGTERINVGAVMGMPLEVFKDQLTMFAEEVMPAFPGWKDRS